MGRTFNIALSRPLQGKGRAKGMVADDGPESEWMARSPREQRWRKTMGSDRENPAGREVDVDKGLNIQLGLVTPLAGQGAGQGGGRR